mgnify:CR=1 FL=1
MKSKPRDAAQDALLYKLLDKPLFPLLRLVIPALEYISMPDLTKEYDDDFPKDIKAALNASRTMVRCFAIHTLTMHSDIVYRRKILAKTALGAFKHEAEGTRSVLDSYDMADMKAIAEERKERAILAGSLFKREVSQGGRRRKGGGRGNNGRDYCRTREQDGSSPRQLRQWW